MTLHVGNCLDILPTLPAESVQCCVTSPPYWGLRDYGNPDQLGMEPTPEEYVARMVAVFAEVRRVLRDDGVLWLNLGDSYVGNASPGGEESRTCNSPPNAKDAISMTKRGAGLKPKDLVGIPWRVAFALQADGWYLRSEVIWHKPNPMPESVTDRPTKAHEQVFLLAKSARYFYDADAVKEEASQDSYRPSKRAKAPWSEHDQGVAGKYSQALCRGQSQGASLNGRNLRSVWTIATRPYSGAHFATFPPELAERCIKSGTSERGCCPACGAPWVRVVERKRVRSNGDVVTGSFATGAGHPTIGAQGHSHDVSSCVSTIGWRPTCHCPDAPPVPCVVLDPFMGAGTVAAAATALNRRWVGIELNPEYARLARERVSGPLFSGVEP